MASSGSSRNPLIRFFVNHVEKIIFGVGIVAVFALLYFGMKTKKFDRSTPVKLSKQHDQARDYMEHPESWDQIQDLRLASTDTEEIIKDDFASPVDHTIYRHGHFMNTRLRTLGLRLDPELKPAQDLTATVVTAPIVIRRPHDVFIEYMTSADAGYVPPKEEEDDDKSGDDGLGGVGAGGGGTGGDFEKKDKKEDEVQSELKRIPSTQELEMPLNPISQVWSYRGPNGNRPEIRECICVTGLVPYESQWKEFDSKLRDAKGWYPLRDRPDYLYIEIQRRTDGGEWTDLTKTLDNLANDIYAPYQATLVPEFVDTKYLHPMLSKLTPPFLGTEYRAVSVHPKVSLRTFFKSEDSADGEDKVAGSKEDPFGLNSGKKDDTGDKGDSKPDDSGKKKMKTPPRDEDPTITGGSGGAQALGQLGAGGGVSMSDIKKEFLQELPSSEYKLVRFFDPTVKSGESYEYRVRVWLMDPNNPDMELVSRANAKGGLQAPESGGGIAAPAAGGGGGQASTGGDFEPSGGGSKGGLDGSDDSKAGGLADIELTVLKSSDLDPKVRDRIKAWEDKVAADPSILPDPALKNARPSPWSEPTAAVKVVEAKAKFFAGPAIRRGVEEFKGIRYYTSDPSISLMVNKQDRDLDVEIPAERRFFAGDLMNFTTNTRFAHPLDWTIHRRNNLKVQSEAVVVGISGGERLSFTVAKVDEERNKTFFTREKATYFAPGEVLIMDAAGNFAVRNELDDKRSYRHGQFARDEQLVGKPAKIEKEEDPDESERRGRRRGGGGDAFSQRVHRGTEVPRIRWKS